MPLDDGLDDDEPVYRAPLPPDDRLWRHPSEVGAGLAGRSIRLIRSQPRVWSVALVSGLVGSLLATSLAIAAGRMDHSRPVERVIEQVAVTAAPDNRYQGVAAVAERVRPAIVQIVVHRSDGVASGSGVLFLDDGHVLTNDHVITGSTHVTVVMSDGRKLAGRVLGGDADTDVAVVKIDGGPFPVAPLGSATTLKAGEECIAIGSPLGLAGGPSVSVGVVSALGRSLDAEGGHHLYDMIQTDAAISPGSSGGALLDQAGAVIGVTTAIAVSEGGSNGLGFATPIDVARSVADELIATGRASHVWLGVEGSDVDEDTAEKLAIEGGAAVKRVLDGGPAKAAGIQVGDVIVSIDGQPVTTMAGLVVALRGRRAGAVVTLAMIRHGQPMTLRVMLAERPSSSSP
jgi:S1-C subfamily serine protease